MNLRAALKSRHSYVIAVLIAAIIATDTFNTSTRRMFIFHPSRDTSHSLPFGNIKPDTQLSNRQQWCFSRIYIHAHRLRRLYVMQKKTMIDSHFFFILDGKFH